MKTIKKINKSLLNIYEKIAIKRLRYEGYEAVEKLDRTYKDIKAPDFLFIGANGVTFVCEVKCIAKTPYRKHPVIKDVSYELDSKKIVEQILSEVDIKFKGLIGKMPQWAKLPYIFVVFNGDWLWDGFGFMDNDVYRHFPNISAVFRLKKFDPKQREWEGLSLKDLEEYIKTNVNIRSREKFKWQVILNKCANNPIKKMVFKC